MGNIKLDREHGLNPSLEMCFVCNEPKGVLLFGELKPQQRAAFAKAGMYDASHEYGKAPRQVCLDREPCPKCAEYMAQGVILISVDEDKSPDMQNPYRTGGWVVVRDAWIASAIESVPLREQILTKRMAFIPDDAWDWLGLPRGAEVGHA